MTKSNIEALSEALYSPLNSDDDLASQFVDQHGDKLRYVVQWRKWMVWTALAGKKIRRNMFVI